MELLEGFSFLNYLGEKEIDEMLWKRWLHLQHTGIGFNEFKEQLKPKPAKSDSEILDEVKDILDTFIERRDPIGVI